VDLLAACYDYKYLTLECYVCTFYRRLCCAAAATTTYCRRSTRFIS